MELGKKGQGGYSKIDCQSVFLFIYFTYVFLKRMSKGQQSGQFYKANKFW